MFFLFMSKVLQNGNFHFINYLLACCTLKKKVKKLISFCCKENVEDLGFQVQLRGSLLQ